MPLFDLYDLPYEATMKIVTKGEFPTIVNFFKASTFTKMIIEKNYPLEEMEENEKPNLLEMFDQFAVSYATITKRYIPRLGSIAFKSFIYLNNVDNSWNDPPIASNIESIIAAREKKKKQLMKRQRKTQKAAKQLPAKHFCQSVKTPRGKSFPFRQ